MSPPRNALAAWFKANWRIISQIASGCFVVAVLVLLAVLAVKVDWAEVIEAMKAYDARVLCLATLYSVASFIVYSGFDAVGKIYTEHELSWFKTMLVGFISYAFSLNMGSAVGGAGLRLRLYSRLGLSKGAIMRVIGLSVTTNWVGYLWLAGAVFASGLMSLPAQWKIGSLALQLIGFVLLLLGLGYLLLCATSKKREWEIKGHSIELPSLRLALSQVAMAMLNWSLMAAIIYVLLEQSVGYFVVLGLLLITAVAGAVVHMPAGLGVIETIFIGGLYYYSVARADILAALVAYRAVYYLIPLFFAGLSYFAIESRISSTANLDSEP